MVGLKEKKSANEEPMLGIFQVNGQASMVLEPRRSRNEERKGVVEIIVVTCFSGLCLFLLLALFSRASSIAQALAFSIGIGIGVGVGIDLGLDGWREGER
jgi:hypothetical protein